MPRVNGVFQLPPGVYGVAGAPIQSVPYNTVLDDFTADANTPRPIGAGGTGSTSAPAALAALGALAKAGDTSTGSMTFPGLNIKGAGNRPIQFVDTSSTVRGTLFQDASTNDLFLQKATGETLRIGSTGFTYNGDGRFSRADGSGYVFLGSGANHYIGHDNTRYILSASGLFVDGKTEIAGDMLARDGQFSRGNGEGYVYFAGTSNRYIGFDGTRYVFNIAGVAIGGASTIGGVAILTAAEISASRTRHITTNGLDNFIVALIDAAGSSIPTIGADYAGSVFYDAAGGGVLSYTGTWRCLSRASGAAPYAGLFYKFA